VRSAARRNAAPWKIVVRVCQAALVVLVVFAVWSVGIASDGDGAQVLPDTDVQFSLEMTVVGSADHPVVYALEQRARPDYRIFAFDPSTGEDTTVFSVPERALVYGIALNADRSKLAVTYSPDFDLDGSGLWILDLRSGELTRVRGVEAGVYHVDPVWTAEGTAVLTTRVDRRHDTERLGISRTSAVDGRSAELVADAIEPSVVGNDVFALSVDEQQARRGIVRVRSGHATEIVSGTLDLDHLVADPAGIIHVAAIEAPEPSGGLIFGSVASAHGNHRRPSSWWTVDIDAVDRRAEPSALPPSIVHDASPGDGAVVLATAEGLELAVPESDIHIDLIKSRAIRLVAA
jgi:hypothetical protein